MYPIIWILNKLTHHLFLIQGKTGFPWIDAIMVQLREVGWIHHLARYAIACFLTRGDLWISWEEGFKVRDAVTSLVWLTFETELTFWYSVNIASQKGKHVDISDLCYAHA